MKMLHDIKKDMKFLACYCYGPVSESWCSSACLINVAIPERFTMCQVCLKIVVRCLCVHSKTGIAVIIPHVRNSPFSCVFSGTYGEQNPLSLQKYIPKFI